MGAYGFTSRVSTCLRTSADGFGDEDVPHVRALGVGRTGADKEIRTPAAQLGRLAIHLVLTREFGPEALPLEWSTAFCSLKSLRSTPQRVDAPCSGCNAWIRTKDL